MPGATDGRRERGSFLRGGLPEALRRLTIRGALYAGFGLIFVVWVAAGIDMVSRLIDVDQRMSAINSRFTEAERLVATVRSEVLIGSIYLRDALLDKAENIPYYRKLLHDNQTSLEETLDDYDPIADSPAEREALQSLRAELEKFWVQRMAVIDREPARRSSDDAARLLPAGIPKRDEIMRLSNGIQDLHRASFARQRAELAATYAAMRQRVWVTSGLALVLTLGVAFMVTTYAGRLERRIGLQRILDQQKTRNLQRLSARLVHAQEEERRAIARELHDEIGQALTAIKLEVAAAERAMQTGADASRALGGVRTLLDHALQTARDLSQLLHPALLDDLGLPAALDLQVTSFAARTGIAADLSVQRMEERLPPEVEVCLYRVAQEALTNIARHAKASSCRIHLERGPDSVTMTVEDDGKGFDQAEPHHDARRQGLGLLGIRERAINLRGNVTVESAPGKGTRVTVDLPIAAPPHPAENGASAGRDRALAEEAP